MSEFSTFLDRMVHSHDPNAPPLKHGIIQFHTADSDLPEVFLAIDAAGVRRCAGVHESPDAVVRIKGEPAELLRLLGGLDVRNTEVFERLEFTGNPEALEAVWNLALLPHEALVETFALAERRAMPRHAVPRVRRPEPKDVLEALRSSTPMIVSDAVSDWPEAGRTWAGLVEAHGDVKLNDLHGSFTLRDFDASLDASAGVALGRVYSSAEVPQPMTSAIAPPIIGWSPGCYARLWTGKRVDAVKPQTSLHRDPQGGILVQVEGRKRVLLCSPTNAESLYCEKNYNRFQACWTTLGTADLDRFPRVSEVSYLTVVLSPGEALVTPPGWFHEVYAASAFMHSFSFTIPNGLYDAAFPVLDFLSPDYYRAP